MAFDTPPVPEDDQPSFDEEPAQPAPDEVGARGQFHLPADVGGRVLSDVQPKLTSEGIGGYFETLLGNIPSGIKDNIKGMFDVATFPISHPGATLHALATPDTMMEAADTVAGGILTHYKEAYTPQPNESIPGMLLRRFKEKPVDSLLDVSILGRTALGGGAGMLSQVANLTEDGSRIGAVAERGADLLSAGAERMKYLDPLTLATEGGIKILNRVIPDQMAAIKATSLAADVQANETMAREANETQLQNQLNQVFSPLNDAERAGIHHYIEGRINFDRPVGEQLMQSNGQWAPVKGDTIRPDVMEQVRQQYLPIQAQLEKLRGWDNESVAATAGENAGRLAEKVWNDAARDPEHAWNTGGDGITGEFDPMHPQVQDFIQRQVQSALAENNASKLRRATGTMRTALDIAQDNQWQSKLKQMVAENQYASIEDAQRGFPQPARTTPQEALAAMGPQGGTYWPHSGEVEGRAQSTVGRWLTRLGPASAFKENTYAQFAAGVLDNQDPVQTLMRAFAAYDKGRTWPSLAHEIVKDAAERGEGAQVMPKSWNPNVDPDYIARTHQPFDPAHLMNESMVADDAHRLGVRAMEAAGETGPLNMVDLHEGVARGADAPGAYPTKDLPKYKITSELGHALKDIKNSLEPTTNPLVRLYDDAMGFWNWNNLGLRTGRLVAMTGGHMTFAAMMGVHPFSVQGLSALAATGHALLGKMGLGGETGEQLARVFELPGIASGGVQRSIGEVSGGFGKKLMNVTTPGLSTAANWFGRYGNTINNAAKNIDATFRAAGMFYELSPNAIQRAQRMLGHIADAPTLASKIASFADAGGDVMKLPEYTQALKGVTRFFGDYVRQTPFERNIIRRAAPYYKFIKHTVELGTRFPFEHPLRAVMMRSAGEAIHQDVRDTAARWGFDFDKDVPERYQNAIPVRADIDPETGKQMMTLITRRGVFDQLTDPDQTLGPITPLAKMAIEQATGINLFRRERYRGALSSAVGREWDPNEGRVVDTFHHPSVGEGMLRTFWEYNDLKKWVANGRIPTDTASLLEMATNPRMAFEYDAQGKPKRNLGQAGPLGEAIKSYTGTGPVRVAQPPPGGSPSDRGAINSQLDALWQRFPDRHQDIMDSIGRAQPAEEGE